jgi:hypothetical protein
VSNNELPGILLFGEEITKDACLIDTLRSLKSRQVFQALGTRRVLRLLDENPEIRWILVCDLEYANLSDWIGLVKSLHSYIRVVVFTALRPCSVVGADNSLQHSLVPGGTRSILRSILAA